MKLSVAANYDLDLISKLAGSAVTEVYGKFPADLVGGGRPSYMGTPLTSRDLAAYVADLNRHDIGLQLRHRDFRVHKPTDDLGVGGRVMRCLHRPKQAAGA